MAQNEKDLPLLKNQTKKELANQITKILFDQKIASKRLCREKGKDFLKNSAVNFYENISQKEAEDFYSAMRKESDLKPISYGLNSKLVKEGGEVREKVWRAGGMYGAAIEKIVFHLEKAKKFAENKEQEAVIEKLIEFYKTGDLKKFDEYSVLWTKEQNSEIDFVNGFIEVYGDPIGLKGNWESFIHLKNIEATKRTDTLSANAQWFEDNSPIDKRFKKEKVLGISAKVTDIIQLGGECFPVSFSGVNLPNSDWIRKEHGSKSVTLENIVSAYDKDSIESGFLQEFAAGEEEIKLIKKDGFLANCLSIDLHECLGHGSGQTLDGVGVHSLGTYHSTLEEARADLFALYYIFDPKMIELGLIPSFDIAKTEYMIFIRAGLLTQLTRIEKGKDIEEDHMRDRQLIASWCYEKGRKDNVIEFFKKNGKTFVKINDFEKLRGLFKDLLCEIQRIKSEGDFEAGKKLVEKYGIKVDKKIHAEVLARFEKLNIAPFSGFVNPNLLPVEKDGKIVDIKIEYPKSYTKQMLNYSKNYSFLPTEN